MDIIVEAEDFAERKIPLTTTNERIMASREVRKIILALNELYKESQEQSIMDLMKRLTVKKQKIEKRLKGRPSS